MKVLRIVPNLAAPDPQSVRDFYAQILDLRPVMDHDWIVTLAGDGQQIPQVSIAREGGSGTPVPTLSIEVDDVDLVHVRAVAAGCEITYPMTDEPWGVRRFYLRDPAGMIVNILSHGRSPTADG